MSVGRALYRSLLHRVGRGRLRELLDEVPFRIPATALPLCGEEAFVRAGQPIPTLRYDPHGPPVSLGPPPVATRADLLRLVQVSFKTEVRDGEDAERMEGAFEGLRRLTALQSQLEGLVQTREKRDGDREQVRYSIGEVFRHQARYAEALVMYDKNLKINIKLHGANHHTVASTKVYSMVCACTSIMQSAGCRKL